jgi:hypothetical protein
MHSSFDAVFFAEGCIPQSLNLTMSKNSVKFSNQTFYVQGDRLYIKELQASVINKKWIPAWIDLRPSTERIPDFLLQNRTNVNHASFTNGTSGELTV